MTYGIPYRGSKSKIIESLALLFPAAENFYDLFGGGFAVTHYLAANKPFRFRNFYYNELEEDVVALVRKALAGEYNYDKFVNTFVTREEFNEKKKDDAYIRLLWSFGNNQINYLYGKHIEKKKESLHNAIVFGSFDETARELLGMSAWPPELTNITQRRLYLLQSTGGVMALEHLQRLERLQHLRSLERLQRLESVDSSRIHLSSGSYKDVVIKPNSVIYCDIPYEGTGGYVSKFDKSEFLEWAAAQTCPVFISEYSLSHPKFKQIYEIDRAVASSSRGSVSCTEETSEKVFWNGVKI